MVKLSRIYHKTCSIKKIEQYLSEFIMIVEFIGSK